jgi:hypothetical protein
LFTQILSVFIIFLPFQGSGGPGRHELIQGALESNKSVEAAADSIGYNKNIKII